MERRDGRLSRPSAPVQTYAATAHGISYARNEEIFGEGEPADYVYQVVSGAARTYKVLSDGRRQIGAFYLPGGVFGLGVGDLHHCSAEAISKSMILVINRDRGTPRDAAPPPPPGIRVRTTAVREFG